MDETHSRLSGQMQRVAAALPQSAVAQWLAHRATSRRLRILAFHGVADQIHFQTLVQEICRRYVPVSGDEVASSLAGEVQLPNHAVWFTFDDGLASTFEAGPMLAAHGVRATAFVCPSVVDRPELLWFQVLELCQERSLLGRDEVHRFSWSRMKSVGDAERRAETQVLMARLRDTGYDFDVRVTVADLRRWDALGHEIGNHTWDHPCLDRCSAHDQRIQIARAHEELKSMGFEPKFFAYPNGNWTAESEAFAWNLGYVGSLLFDHRLTRPQTHPHRLSRLRIDSDASVRRAMSILSGSHSGAFQATSRLRAS